MSTFRSLFKLKEFVRPQFRLLFLAALLALPLAALQTALAPLAKAVIDDLSASRWDNLYLYPKILIALGIAHFVFRFGHYFLMRVAVARINQAIKERMYRHLLGLSADYFTERSVGSLISRVGSDPALIDLGVSSINVLVREPFTFACLFGYAMYLNWRLTLITVIMFPLFAWVFSAAGKNLKRNIQKMQEENARVFSDLQESFTGIRVIQAFRLEGYLFEKIREKFNRFTRIVLKSAAVEEASHPLVELLFKIAMAAMIWFLAIQIKSGQTTPGGLIAFFIAFGMMIDPVRRLNELNLKVNMAAGAADRLHDLLAWKSHLTLRTDAKAVRTFEKSVAFENVSFAYPDNPSKPVLKSVSFDIPKNAVVALVGESGSGKSSLVSLIPRLYDVTGGAITIDGRDIRDIQVESLRDLISVVSQEVFLFNDTIEENIRCGHREASLADIREAARHANALDFIERSPHGFQTVIGDRGQKLSGGERQRLSIARAFLRKAPILILDEATSNLDNASERAVQTALEHLMEDRTTLVIAHRLSTIKNADRILVMKSGEIVESGTHADLVAKQGEYAHFQRLGSH